MAKSEDTDVAEVKRKLPLIAGHREPTSFYMQTGIAIWLTICLFNSSPVIRSHKFYYLPLQSGIVVACWFRSTS